MSQSNLPTIDLDHLVLVSGGQAQQGDEEGPPSRTWGQVARDYTAACVNGAGQSFLYGGRPRNWREGVTQAAIGCGMGVGMRALEDVTGMIGGN